MQSLILGLLLLMAGVAHAEPGETFVIGSGHDSCGMFIAAIGNDKPGRYRETNRATGVFVSENRAYQEWLEGFVSGFNAAQVAHRGKLEQQVTKIDLAGMDLWVRNWCNKHPTETVFHGAETFIIEMLTNAAAARR
jgi:hypothetical protein